MSRRNADTWNRSLQDAVARRIPAHAAAYSVVDPVTGLAEVVSSHSFNADVRAELRKPSELPGVPRHLKGGQYPLVDVRYDASLASSSEAINGGDKMTPIGSTSLSCTAAFPARQGTTAGLMTAAHCRNDMDIDGRDAIFNASISTNYDSADVQWHQAKETVNARFRYDWGSYRSVSAHPVLKVDTRVCRFGAATGTGSGCTSVKYVSACTTYSNQTVTFCGLAMTHGHTGSSGGDSGGPWYYGNNAYGVHSGSNTRDGANRNWFSSSNKSLGLLGLTGITG